MRLSVCEWTLRGEREEGILRAGILSPYWGYQVGRSNKTRRRRNTILQPRRLNLLSLNLFESQYRTQSSSFLSCDPRSHTNNIICGSKFSSDFIGPIPLSDRSLLPWTLLSSILIWLWVPGYKVWPVEIGDYAGQTAPLGGGDILVVILFFLLLLFLFSQQEASRRKDSKM